MLLYFFVRALKKPVISLGRSPLYLIPVNVRKVLTPKVVRPTDIHSVNITAVSDADKIP